MVTDRSPRVLVVEDDVEISQVLKRSLRLEGYDVREMIGGVEYWVREGFPLRTAGGDVVRDADPLTAPTCGC